MLDNALAMLSKTVIVAPVSGYIATKNVEVGNTVSPGVPLMRLVAAGAVEFEVNLSESDFAKVQDGQPVFVRVDTLPNQVLKGFVSKLVPVAEAASRQFKIKVVLPAPTSWSSQVHLLAAKSLSSEFLTLSSCPTNASLNGKERRASSSSLTAKLLAKSPSKSG